MENCKKTQAGQINRKKDRLLEFHPQKCKKKRQPSKDQEWQKVKEKKDTRATIDSQLDFEIHISERKLSNKNVWTIAQII